MQIYLRINQEQNVNQITNYNFKSNTSTCLTLCLLPPFVQGAKCGCGKDAVYMTNDSNYKCQECVRNNFPTSKLISNQDISSPITKRTIRDIKFEWSVNQEKWSTLWGRNIDTVKWDYLLNKIKEIILRDKEIQFEAEYDKDKRRMTIL